jgi:DNA-binding LacI/PurR family transcriptional regulator
MPKSRKLDRVIKKRVATVNVSSRLPDLPVPTVVSDNAAIGELAANHLLGKGLKSFAFAGPMDLDHNVQRLAGFTRALEKTGGTPHVLEVRFIHRLLENDKHSIVDTHR